MEDKSIMNWKQELFDKMESRKLDTNEKVFEFICNQFKQTIYAPLSRIDETKVSMKVVKENEEVEFEVNGYYLELFKGYAINLYYNNKANRLKISTSPSGPVAVNPEVLENEKFNKDRQFNAEMLDYVFYKVFFEGKY